MGSKSRQPLIPLLPLFLHPLHTHHYILLNLTLWWQIPHFSRQGHIRYQIWISTPLRWVPFPIRWCNLFKSKWSTSLHIVKISLPLEKFFLSDLCWMYPSLPSPLFKWLFLPWSFTPNSHLSFNIFLIPQLDHQIINKHLHTKPRMMRQGLPLGLLCPCAFMYICFWANVSVCMCFHMFWSREPSFVNMRLQSH